MTEHKVVDPAQWQAARDELLVREKQHTRMADELARQRRELPWVAIEKEYRFDTDDGTRTLAELFDGRSQLLVYHFMFGPSYQAGDPVNSSIADTLDALVPHLQARDLTLLLVSQAPLAKLQAYKRRMGWRLPWVSAAPSDFNLDLGASATEQVTPPGEGGLPPIVAQNAAAAGTDLVGYLSEAPVVSVFTLQDGAVYQTYATTWRGVEFLMATTRSWTGRPRAATRATPGRPGFAATTSTSRALEAIMANSAPGGPTTSIPGSSWSSSRESSSSSAGRGRAGASGAAP